MKCDAEMSGTAEAGDLSLYIHPHEQPFQIELSHFIYWYFENNDYSN